MYDLKIILFFLFFTFLSYGQDKKDLYNWFDKEVGVHSSSIFEGETYKKKHISVKNSHPFYKNNQFYKGDIVYDGESFFDLDLKYDLHDQEIIVRLKDKNGTHLPIKIFKDKIQYLTIDGAKFINFKKGNSKENDNFLGLYEIIYDSKRVKLLVGHNKSISERLDRGKMFAKYVNDEEKYFIFYKGKYNEVKSKRDLRRIFPEKEKVVEKYYATYKKLRKDNKSLFWVKLIEALDQN